MLTFEQREFLNELIKVLDEVWMRQHMRGYNSRANKMRRNKNASRVRDSRIEMFAHLYFDKAKTMEQIAVAHNLSRERVRQILNKSEAYQNRMVKFHNTTTKRIVISCKFCGKEHRVTPKYPKIFCNNECRKAHTIRKWETMTERTCSKCGVTKPIDEFNLIYVKGRSTKARHSECKVCFNAIVAEWDKTHPKAIKAITKRASRKWYWTHREEALRKQREIYQRKKLQKVENKEHILEHASNTQGN